MRRLLLSILLPLAISCNKESAPVVQTEGMWAEYSGSELTKAFYEFNEGRYGYYISDEDCLIRYSCLWGAEKTDFNRWDFGDYSVQDGNLILNGRNAGPVSRNADTLTIDTKRYVKINELKKGVKGASKIILEKSEVNCPASSYEELVKYRIVNLLSDTPAVSVRYEDSPPWVLYPFVSYSQITVGAKNNLESSKARSTVMIVSYPGAEDERIVLNQAAGIAAQNNF